MGEWRGKEKRRKLDDEEEKQDRKEEKKKEVEEMRQRAKISGNRGGDEKRNKRGKTRGDGEEEGEMKEVQ